MVFISKIEDKYQSSPLYIYLRKSELFECKLFMFPIIFKIALEMTITIPILKYMIPSGWD